MRIHTYTKTHSPNSLFRTFFHYILLFQGFEVNALQIDNVFVQVQYNVDSLANMIDKEQYSKLTMYEV